MSDDKKGPLEALLAGLDWRIVGIVLSSAIGGTCVAAKHTDDSQLNAASLSVAFYQQGHQELAAVRDTLYITRRELDMVKKKIAAKKLRLAPTGEVRWEAPDTEAAPKYGQAGSGGFTQSVTKAGKAIGHALAFWAW